MEPLWKVRDRVLDRALADGADVLLDVGCGDGLIGFGALQRGVGTVIFGDASEGRGVRRMAHAYLRATMTTRCRHCANGSNRGYAFTSFRSRRASMASLSRAGRCCCAWPRIRRRCTMPSPMR